MDAPTKQLINSLRSRILELTDQAIALPAVADGHTMLAAEAGFGKGPISKDQLIEIRDGALLIGKTSGIVYATEEIDKVIDAWLKHQGIG